MASLWASVLTALEQALVKSEAMAQVNNANLKCNMEVVEKECEELRVRLAKYVEQLWTIIGHGHLISFHEYGLTAFLKNLFYIFLNGTQARGRDYRDEAETSRCPCSAGYLHTWHSPRPPRIRFFFLELVWSDDILKYHLLIPSALSVKFIPSCVVPTCSRRARWQQLGSGP